MTVAVKVVPLRESGHRGEAEGEEKRKEESVKESRPRNTDGRV